jgi:primosomal protein N'
MDPSTRLAVNTSCPKCTGHLSLSKDTSYLNCSSCSYQETIAENVKRNVRYYINGKEYTQEEAKAQELIK